jgi:hypothetical protein
VLDRRYARRPWARASTGGPRHPRSSTPGSCPRRRRDRSSRAFATPAGGAERDLRISGASGAYVAAIPAAAWTLTGYGVDGERLGVLTMDHRDADG